MALTVIFDLDGTLVDNSYMHTLAWWYACRDHGIAVKMATIHRLVGMGGDQIVPAMIGREMPALDEAHSRHYRPHLDEVPVLPGAAELLGELHRRDATLCLATSGGPEDAEILLGKIETRGLLDHVVTKESVGASKRAPDLALVALRVSGAEPEDAVFVGDTRWDVEAAGRAGVACVGVCSGGWSEQELREVGPSTSTRTSRHCSRTSTTATSAYACTSGRRRAARWQPAGGGPRHAPAVACSLECAAMIGWATCAGTSS
jgi:HAD superfamily hydrolase (TIGR01509 family)